MQYAQIRKIDISDGPGIRVALYTQGCPIRCAGCHNESIWEFGAGHDFTEQTCDKIIELAKHRHIAGLSILGGEPLIPQNFETLLKLCLKFKAIYPGKTVWLWTGFTFESLLRKYSKNAIFMSLLRQIDVLVDGPFKQNLKDITLKYAGSRNQRVIMMQKTLDTHKICIYAD